MEYLHTFYWIISGSYSYAHNSYICNSNGEQKNLLNLNKYAHWGITAFMNKQSSIYLRHDLHELQHVVSLY